MMQQVYSVYDGKAEAYLPPFLMNAKGMAERAFMQALLDTDHMFAKFPGDYYLFFVGMFDDSTGLFHYEDEQPSKTLLGNGIEYLAMAKREMDRLDMGRPQNEVDERQDDFVDGKPIDIVEARAEHDANIAKYGRSNSK